AEPLLDEHSRDARNPDTAEHHDRQTNQTQKAVDVRQRFREPGRGVVERRNPAALLSALKLAGNLVRDRALPPIDRCEEPSITDAAAETRQAQRVHVRGIHQEPGPGAEIQAAARQPHYHVPNRERLAANKDAIPATHLQALEERLRYD